MGEIKRKKKRGDKEANQKYEGKEKGEIEKTAFG